MQRHALASMIGAASFACVAVDEVPGDRIAELAEALPPPGDDRMEAFLGEIELPRASIDDRRIGPVPLVPARSGRAGELVIVEFAASGLRGAKGKLGLLPPRGAARQEVAYDKPGQPADPRSVWVDVEIGVDGVQRFELPAPGLDWHADWAVVALELQLGSTPVLVQTGPRSEMLSDETRALGGRIVLGVVPVARTPTRVQARRAATPIVLDGRLDEDVWQQAGATLVQSRDGEPSQIDEQVGGPTQVWFAWDDEQLYVAASLPDHDLFAPHHGRDDPLYREEAFELFVAADGSGKRYLEHQVSARNVVFDARFERYRKGEEGWNGSWRSAVVLDGELERAKGDRGWTVELAFAWAELCEHTNIRCPAKAGAALRVNAFRVEKPTREGQVGLALSPTIEPDFHAWANAAELELLGPGVSP